MKRFILSFAVMLAVLTNSVAQTQEAIYEFPNTPCAGGNTNPYPDCFGTHCTPCMAPDAVGSNVTWNNMTTSAALGDIEVCRASNTASDSYFHVSGWNMTPSNSEWVSTDGLILGIQLQFDSVVVVYRAQGPTLGRIQATFNTDMLSTMDAQPLLNDTSWSSVTFDLSSMPCSDADLFATFKIRFSAYGNSDPNGYVDIDAIRVYGHDCLGLSTIVQPVQMMETDDATILPLIDGVQVTTHAPSEVSVCDAAGRVTYFKSNWNGTDFIRMGHGMYIVRAGNAIKKVVLQ